MSDTSELQGKLAALPIFQGLTNRQLKRLVEESRRSEHQPGHEVATEGEGALSMHLILGGTAEVTRGGQAVRTLGEGDHFGEISMIDGKKRSATVTAVTSLQTLAVPHFAFEQLLKDEPGFAATLLVLLCARLREAESA
jgi:CRP/FNR family transcriptional regulator, cyclic AMP receptor protein